MRSIAFLSFAVGDEIASYAMRDGIDVMVQSRHLLGVCGEMCAIPKNGRLAIRPRRAGRPIFRSRALESVKFKVKSVKLWNSYLTSFGGHPAH